MTIATRHSVPIKSPYPRHKYSIIIPAAGAGHRMKSYGPKSLFRLKHKYLIHYQLHIIQSLFKKCEIILVVGFQAQKLMKHVPSNVIIVENERYNLTNVARSIGMGLRAATTDKVLVIYGDLYFNRHALSIPFNDKSTVVVCNTMHNREIGCISNNHIVEHLDFNLPNKWAQITYFTGKELQLLQNICWHPEYYKHYGFQLINEVMNRGGRMKEITPRKAVAYDIDTQQDLQYVLTTLEGK